MGVDSQPKSEPVVKTNWQIPSTYIPCKTRRGTYERLARLLRKGLSPGLLVDIAKFKFTAAEYSAAVSGVKYQPPPEGDPK